MQISDGREFVAWAFRENPNYRTEPDVYKRMNGAVYLTPTCDGFDLASKGVRGLVPVELDRAVGCGWRLLDGDGRSRTGWRFSRNVSTAMSEANNELWEQDRALVYGGDRSWSYPKTLRVWRERDDDGPQGQAPTMR